MRLHGTRIGSHFRAAVAILLAAFGGGCAAEPAAPAAERDTLVFASSADATTLDPHNTTDTQSDQVIWMVYNALIRYDPQMNIVGDLAESWEMSEDELTWTFHLREGVRFHDGSPFTAESVKRNFDRVLDPRQGHKRLSLFEAIDRVEVADPRTVRIITKFPFGAFEPTMAHVSAAIVSPEVADQHGADFGLTPESTSGTGPYKVVSWRKDQEIVLERNDDYWGEPGRLARIVYRPIPEAASRVIALESGDVDVITHIPPRDVARLDGLPGIQVLKGMSIGAQMFRFNCVRGPLADPRVRLAIAYAVDRRAIVDNLVAGLAVPSTGPLTPIMRGRADLGEFPHDPDKARALLADAGYPDGFETTISTTPRYNMGVELAEALAAQLRGVGITARIEVLEWGAMRQFWGGIRPEDNPQEIFIMGAGASSADADWGLRPVYMTTPTGTNENNYGYYSNAEFDDLVMRAMQEPDRPEREALYQRAQEIVYQEDPPGIWLYDNFYVVGARSNVRDITTSPLGVVTFEAASLVPES